MTDIAPPPDPKRTRQTRAGRFAQAGIPDDPDAAKKALRKRRNIQATTEPKEALTIYMKERIIETVDTIATRFDVAPNQVWTRAIEDAIRKYGLTEEQQYAGLLVVPKVNPFDPMSNPAQYADYESAAKDIQRVVAQVESYPPETRLANRAILDGIDPKDLPGMPGAARVEDFINEP